MDRHLRLTARISAWILLIFIIVSNLSGRGTTRTGIINIASLSLIDRGLANSIHLAIQVPMATVFLIYVLINARIGLGSRLDRKT